MSLGFNTVGTCSPIAPGAYVAGVVTGVPAVPPGWRPPFSPRECRRGGALVHVERPCGGDMVRASGSTISTTYASVSEGADGPHGQHMSSGAPRRLLTARGQDARVCDAWARVRHGLHGARGPAS